MAKSSMFYTASAVAAALTVIGMILNAVSVGTDYWISAGPLGYFGLWRSCGTDQSGPDCTLFKDLPVWWDVASTLIVLAGILSVATVSFIVLAAIARSPTLSTVAVISSVLASALLAIGMLVWAYEIEPDEIFSNIAYFYDWSFFVGWVGVGFYLFGSATTGVQLYIVSRLDRVNGSYKVLPDAQPV